MEEGINQANKTIKYRVDIVGLNATDVSKIFESPEEWEIDPDVDRLQIKNSCFLIKSFLLLTQFILLDLMALQAL